MSDFEFDGIEELKRPTEVLRAATGDRAPLIALLRSERPLSRRTRLALADWLAAELPKKKPGRPPSYVARVLDRIRWSAFRGHDIDTDLGRAGYRYERLREAIRRVGRHKKAAGARHWSAEKTLEVVADWAGVESGKLADYIKRGPKPARSLPPEDGYRVRIIREVSPTKKRSKSPN